MLEELLPVRPCQSSMPRLHAGAVQGDQDSAEPEHDELARVEFVEPRLVGELLQELPEVEEAAPVHALGE